MDNCLEIEYVPWIGPILLQIIVMKVDILHTLRNNKVEWKGNCVFNFVISPSAYSQIFWKLSPTIYYILPLI